MCWPQEGPCAAQSLSHSPKWLTALHFSPQTSSTSFLLFIFSWWPCFLYIKNESKQKKTLHVSLHLCPYSAFPIVLWLSPPLLPLVLTWFSSRALHGFSAHPILLPTCELRRPCFPLQLGYSYQHMDMLKYCSSLKTTETKTPPNTTSFFNYSPREFLWAAVLTVPFGSAAIRFFLFCCCNCSCWDYECRPWW